MSIVKCIMNYMIESANSLSSKCTNMDCRHYSEYNKLEFRPDLSVSRYPSLVRKIFALISSQCEVGKVHNSR